MASPGVATVAPSPSNNASSNNNQQATAPPRRLTISLKPLKYLGGNSSIPGPGNPGLALNLYPTHFTLQTSEFTYQYHGPLHAVIEAVNKQQLTPELLKYADSFHNGILVAKVHDHRLGARPVAVIAAVPPPMSAATPQSHNTSTASHILGTNDPMILPTPITQMAQPLPQIEPLVPQIYNLELRPTMKTLWYTLTSLSQPLAGVSNDLGANADASGWTMEFATRVEATVLPQTEPPLCLDPSTKVVRLANEIAFNEQKFLLKPKRKRNWAEIQEEEAKKRKESSKLLYREERHEFHPSFSRFAFIEDWKRKKHAADMEVLPGIDSKHRNKASRKLQIHLGKKLFRTVKWERNSEKGKIYTIMNIYEVATNEYEAVFRWGTTEGTAAGNGVTLRYPIGNATAVEYYLAHLKGFYAIEKNNLVADIPLSRVAPSVPQQTATLGPQTGSPATVPHNNSTATRTPSHGAVQQATQRPTGLPPGAIPVPSTASRPTPSAQNQARVVAAFNAVAKQQKDQKKNKLSNPL